MTSPAIENHRPRELRDVLMADRERLLEWLKRIQARCTNSDHTVIWCMCDLALKGEDPP